MKKLMISMAVALIASASLANATNVFGSSEVVRIASQEKTASQEKVEIKTEELPDVVKSALQAEPYNAWQVQKAFLVPDGNGSNYYEISLSKGEEMNTVKLDKDGKVIE